ncbi:hypothetical protein SAMN02745129_2146 [Ferrimonas marina]|uniref:Uncharacterized protein n=2 Tax=Ferrimonas marina TaxID=299255 RepID=A0A1M5THJ8_9GAMM|nr:hypothetical protein SAMN02745129_2146 [Ferrimonas marina]
MSFKPAVKPNHPGVLTQKISGAGSREHTQEVMVGKLWPGTNDTSILAQFRSPAIAAREANLVALLRASDLIKQAALGTKVPDELIYHCLYQAQASGQEAHPQVYDLEAVLRSVVGALGPFFGRKEQTLSHLHIAQAITGARGLSTRLATESDVKLALQNIRKSWPSKVRYQVAPGSVFFKLR